jgi:hypothetical protein
VLAGVDFHAADVRRDIGRAEDIRRVHATAYVHEAESLRS